VHDLGLDCFNLSLCLTQRFQMTKNPPNISSPDVISRFFFPNRFQHICTFFISGDCMCSLFYRVFQIVVIVAYKIEKCFSNGARPRPWLFQSQPLPHTEVSNAKNPPKMCAYNNLKKIDILPTLGLYRTSRLVRKSGKLSKPGLSGNRNVFHPGRRTFRNRRRSQFFFQNFSKKKFHNFLFVD
jgi:hypothetical protein